MTVPVQEAADLAAQVVVLRRAAEAAVGHALADVQLGLHAGVAQLGVHAGRVRQEESRVPACRKVGGNPATSANNGDRYGWARS